MIQVQVHHALHDSAYQTFARQYDVAEHKVHMMPRQRVEALAVRLTRSACRYVRDFRHPNHRLHNNQDLQLILEKVQLCKICADDTDVVKA